MSREIALATYRNLLRSIRIAFQGDEHRLTTATLLARRDFENARALPTSSESWPEKIRNANEVAKILRENVVQGRPTDTEGNYKLRIHEHTERGNNEDIKKGKGNTLAGTKCCSS